MTRKGRDAKAAWTGAETEASRRDKELPAAAKPGPPSQCDSMVGYDGYCYTHKRAGEDCQTIRALEARVKERNDPRKDALELRCPKCGEWTGCAHWTIRFGESYDALKARAEKAEAVECRCRQGCCVSHHLDDDLERESQENARAAFREKP